MPPRTKDAVIGLLVLANIALLCTALTYLVSLPQAHAQQAPTPPAGQYLAVSGQVQTGMDAQYILDLNQQRLYVYAPGRSGSHTSASAPLSERRGSIKMISAPRSRASRR